MLLSADVVQEVDIVLAQLLRGLAQSGLLHTEVADLSAQRTEALSHLLTNAKLLGSQIADALSQLLLQLGLLTKDVGLLTCHACVLTSKTRLLTSQLTIQARSALAELTLLTSSLHLTLTSSLGETCALQTQLAQLLACAQGAQTRLLQLLSSLHAQLSALQTILRLHLLVRQSSLHGLLGIHARSLHLSGLVLHVCLLLCVKVSQSGLKTSLSAQLLNT